MFYLVSGENKGNPCPQKSLSYGGWRLSTFIQLFYLPWKFRKREMCPSKCLSCHLGNLCKSLYRFMVVKFDCKISFISSCIGALGTQLLILFQKASEPLRGGPLLEEMNHWGWSMWLYSPAPSLWMYCFLSTDIMWTAAWGPAAVFFTVLGCTITLVLHCDPA